MEASVGNIVTVDFRQDTLFAVERDDGVFVAVKPICDSLGLRWSGQHERLNRDAILAEGIRVIPMPTPGGTQDTTVLKLELVNGWLFGIDESRVKDEETRQRVLAYKRECYGVLFDHFYGKRKVKAEPEVVDEPQENESVKLRMVNEGRQVFGTQAAAQLWFKLGLPVVPAMYHDPRQPSLFNFSAIKSVDDAAPEAEAA